jgi:hypothetical protein
MRIETMNLHRGLIGLASLMSVASSALQHFRPLLSKWSPVFAYDIALLMTLSCFAFKTRTANPHAFASK